HVLNRLVAGQLLRIQQNHIEGTKELGPSTYTLSTVCHTLSTPCLTSGIQNPRLSKRRKFEKCSVIEESPEESPEESFEHEVEPPAGFPKTEAQAIAWAMGAHPDAFVIETWHKANSRGGRDAKEVPIRNWRSYLAIEAKYQKDREARQTTSNGRNFGIAAATAADPGRKYAEAAARDNQRLSAITEDIARRLTP
ncbi:MAG TPA: hypothetical protein VEH27_12135, partial [Methylomirabilota bacterium]|nr:hypothetical protein [Methylomirabilota bacterium]